VRGLFIAIFDKIGASIVNRLMPVPLSFATVITDAASTIPLLAIHTAEVELKYIEVAQMRPPVCAVLEKFCPPKLVPMRVRDAAPHEGVFLHACDTAGASNVIVRVAVPTVVAKMSCCA
jgi:hypothetical protein